MNECIALIGDSGHAKVIKDLINENGLALKAVFDDKYSEEIRGNITYLHSSKLKVFNCKECYFFVSIGNNEIRKKIVEENKVHELKYETLIASSATISPNAVIGKGCVIMPNAIINADAVIGDHVIINTGSIIEHESVIENYCHIATGSIVMGGAIIGEGSKIEAASVIARLKRVDPWTVTSYGEVIT